MSMPPPPPKLSRGVTTIGSATTQETDENIALIEKLKIAVNSHQDFNWTDKRAIRNAIGEFVTKHGHDPAPGEGLNRNTEEMVEVLRAAVVEANPHLETVLNEFLEDFKTSHLPARPRL